MNLKKASPPTPSPSERGSAGNCLLRNVPNNRGISLITPLSTRRGVGGEAFSPSPITSLRSVTVGSGREGVGLLLRIPRILLQLRIIRDIPLWDWQVSVEGLERTILNLAATTDYGTHSWVGSRCVNSTCNTV